MQKKGVVLLVVVLLLAVAGTLILKQKTTPVPVENTEVAATETPAAETSPEASVEAAPEVTAEQTTEAPAATTDTAEAPAATEAAPAETTEAAAAPAADDNLLAAPAALQVDVAKALEERSYGSAAAPVTIIEYASLTCPHCAHFTNDILPAVKKDLIDTGKARLIYRDFPLDAYAAKAAAMARCADHDKYFDLLEVIFKDQERWTKADDVDAALIQLGTLAGMEADYAKACMNNEELTNALVQRMQDAQKKYDIKATPTFIFNEGQEKFNGGQDIEKFTATVNKLSGGR